MRQIISLICFLMPLLAFAGQITSPLHIRSDAPDKYIVVKGDTLWGISGKFFQDPWRWPYIWGMNKNYIKDPHWIYPGNVMVLDRTNGTLSVGDISKPAHRKIVKLSPKIHFENSTQNAIPSIPYQTIKPFLSQPLVVDDHSLAHAPTIVGLPEERVIVGLGDTVYAKGLTKNSGSRWQAYRPGKLFIDPDTKEVLGREAIYLGSISVQKFANVSTAIVTDAKEEISVGDRLVAATAQTTLNYLPRAPESNINASVISIYGGLTQGGQNTVVTLNKGARDGLETGHVLALFKKGRIVTYEKKPLALPDVRYGLLFVFRVFDKVSYALVMQTQRPVEILDHATTP
ncbi:MAG: LysM peptidoglycan-binding domain-containing protein [Gallionella sp.]